MKIVYKPWGKEEWIELNDYYCYKRIYIDAGHKTSYQLHIEKLETNYIIEGDAEVWLENNEGAVDTFIMHAGDHFTVLPGKKHRVIALTNIILQEVSTPQVDDVIRISDDTNRMDGKIDIEHLRPALCILTAGKGTRIEKYTKWTNKALLPIGEKASISHLIDGTPDYFDIVIAVGYLAEQVIEYVTAAHPNRNVEFIKVNDYDSDLSGPGYSLKCCQNSLQRPFIWAVSDCYIGGGELPPLDGNWVGVSQTSVPEIYSTFEIYNNEISNFTNKGAEGFEWAFIGIAGIYDYKKFWEECGDIEIVDAFYNFDYYSPPFVPKVLPWHDIGTLEGYQSVLDKTGQISLEKLSHSFSYKVGNRFIKLFADEEECKEKIDRADWLANLVPNLIFKGRYVFAYEWLEGKTLYYSSPETQLRFLDWAQRNLLWQSGVAGYSTFVMDKTTSRMPDAVKSFDIPWDRICAATMTFRFHGDLQFDNIVVTPDGQFKLIDWRGGEISGDAYYDLGKLYGGILINYNAAKRNVFEETGLKAEFENWAQKNGYDLEKIKWQTALIWLSMVPLHPAPFSDILYRKSVELIGEL